MYTKIITVHRFSFFPKATKTLTEAPNHWLKHPNIDWSIQPLTVKHPNIDGQAPNEYCKGCCCVLTLALAAHRTTMLV